MKISVMITTRNRCEDLRRTLQMLRKMAPPPDELLLTCDGCTDDTVSMIQREYPAAELKVNEVSRGSVASRDAMLRDAKGDWVVSLDDDSYPIGEDFFARLPALFVSHPEAAVITFPEQRDGGLFSSPGKSPQASGHYSAAYPNCAAVMHRSFYLKQPGFPDFFSHMYEETDYSLQCYQGGRAIWFEPSLTIRHHQSSVQRQPVRRHHQNARNELWSVWMRCPWPQLPIVSAFRVWRQFRYACTEGWRWAMREPIWWLAAIRGLPQCCRNRIPILWPVYYGWMRMARNPITSLMELKRKFRSVSE